MGPDMKPIFEVSGEGGPLLLVDARAARSWRGADEGSGDYEKLCQSFDANDDLEGFEIVVEAHPAVSWEMAGGGTAYVFQLGGGQLRLVRAWLGEDTDEELEQLAALEAPERVAIGDIDVSSGVLALLWAPESGETIPGELSKDFAEVEDTAMGGSAFVLKVAHRRYRCWHDEVSTNTSNARRLTLIPV